MQILNYFDFVNESKNEKKKYPVGTSVWFVAKDKYGNPLYDGVHKVVDNSKKLYWVSGKGYKVQASHSEITDDKAKRAVRPKPAK